MFKYLLFQLLPCKLGGLQILTVLGQHFSLFLLISMTMFMLEIIALRYAFSENHENMYSM